MRGARAYWILFGYTLFLAGVHSETLPVRIWNSLHLQVEPVIAAVSAFLIGVTGVILLMDAYMRQLRRRSVGLSDG